MTRPAKTTGNGLGAGPCTPFAAPTGTTTEYEEGIDIDQTKLNGGAPGASLTDGGIASIDSEEAGPRSKQWLQPGLAVGFRSRQQHLQRDSPGRRIHGMVRQAPRIFFGGLWSWADCARRLLRAGNQLQRDRPSPRDNAHWRILRHNPRSRLGPYGLDQQLPEHSVLRHFEG